jgi:hypothetical protein
MPSPSHLKEFSKRRVASYALFLGIILGTRIPLMFTFQGEPDSSRYLMGVRLWLAGDYNNPLLYACNASSGYYWLAEHLLRITGSSGWDYLLILNLVSLCATLVIAPLVYEISRYLLGSQGAQLSAVIFLLSPAIWWLGVQPHPQILSMSLGLFSLFAFIRAEVVNSSRFWTILCVGMLACALLIKIDAVLLFPSFFGLLLFLKPWNRGIARPLVRTCAMLATASILYLIGRSAILGKNIRLVESETHQSLRYFFAVPSGILALKQAEPTIMALGPAIFLVSIVGLVFLLRRLSREQALRWLILVATWCVPGLVFWFLIAGNNPRHVAVFTLGFLWAGIAGLTLRFGPKITTFAVLIAFLVNLVAVPANSSPSYLLSPNVPASLSALRAREDEIRSMAELAAATGGDICFVGTYTTPYFLEYLLSASNPPTTKVRIDGSNWLIESGRISVILPAVRPVSHIQMPCSPAYSVEFDPEGRRHRFLGRELASSPIWAKLTAVATGERTRPGTK